jgi:hypothetical protein
MPDPRNGSLRYTRAAGIVAVAALIAAVAAAQEASRPRIYHCPACGRRMTVPPQFAGSPVCIGNPGPWVLGEDGGHDMTIMVEYARPWPGEES